MRDIVVMKMLYINVAIATVLLSSQAQAGWIQSLGQSEHCIAMGGACVANKGDFGSFYHNPAAAAGFDGVYGANLRLLDTREVDLIDSSGNYNVEKTNAEGDIVLAPSFSGYWALNEKLTFGLGFGAPFAITADWSNDSGVHRYNMSEQSLFVLELTPMLAFQVSERLRIGAGINIVAFKQLKTESLFPLSFGAALPPALGGAGTVIPTTSDSSIIGSLTLETYGDASLGIPPDNMAISFDEFALTLGIQFDVTEQLTLGAVYRSKTKMEWEGSVTLDLQPAGLGKQVTSFQVDLDMPGHLQIGLAYQFAKNLTWTADLQWTEWSDANGLGSVLIIELDDPLLGFVNDLSVEYDANDTLTWRTGLDYQFNNKWSVQFGYAYDESIFDDEHVDILVYDSNRNILTTGLSYDSPKVNNSGWSATLGVQIIIYESRTIETGESQNLGGFSLPNLLDGDTLSFSSNQEAFEYGGPILAVGLSFERRF
jgi:long-chain fatty acid transport protein